MKLKRFVNNLSLIFASVFIAMAFCEFAIAMFYPQNLGVWYQTRDGIAIHWPKLNTYLTSFKQNIQINSLGMRDHEHAFEKEGRAFRLLLLGDSFMEALQVRFEDSLPSLLKDNLQKTTHFPIEVFNASVSGWGTDDQLTYLTRYGIKFQPDLILIAMTLHNDVSDNLRERFHFFADGKIYERPIQELPPVEHTVLQVKSFMAVHSHLYQLFLHYWRSKEVETTARLLNSHVVDLIHATPREEMKKGWEMTHQLFKKISLIGEQNSAKVAIFLIPLSIQISDKDLSSFLDVNSVRREEISIDQPQQVMKEWGMKESVEVIDLLPFFRKWTEHNQESLYLKNDGHWNKDGHRIAAEIVVRELLKKELVSFHSHRPD